MKRKNSRQIMIEYYRAASSPYPAAYCILQSDLSIAKVFLVKRRNNLQKDIFTMFIKASENAPSTMFIIFHNLHPKH
jgi:hypothetical protein